MLLGLVRPTAGEGLVFGKPITDEPSSIEIRRRAGYVSEDKRLYSFMTAEQMLDFTRPLFPRWSRERERELLAAFRLPLRQKFKALSRGMRTTLALVLALARRPDLLILDEPSEGLDPVATEQMLEAFVRAAAEGASVFFSSHRISEVERIADHVFVIHKGRLALERSLEELRENCRRMHFAFPGRAPVEQMTLPGVRKVLRRVIALSSDAQGEQTVSPMPLINYSRALYDLERLDEAADYCERGYAKARQAGDDLGSSQALLMRAAILRSKGDPRGSEQTLLEAEPLLRRHLPPGHIAFASLASLRALNARALGDAHAALGLFE